MRLQDAWRNTWIDLALPAPGPEVLQALLERYGESHRAYHTAQHLAECFQHFDGARPLAAHAGEVALALWFHDAIYDPHSARNEADSADWADRVLVSAGAGAAMRDRVRGLIMATRHAADPVAPDAQLTVDIDLSILGAAPARFAEYETQVRREYAFVPEAEFRQRRARILRQFLDRPALFATRHFHARLEALARRNLASAIAALEA